MSFDTWTFAVANYVFYAAWNPPFVLLLVLSTIVDAWVARGEMTAHRGVTVTRW